jgi:hypothetical protein
LNNANFNQANIAAGRVGNNYAGWGGGQNVYGGYGNGWGAGSYGGWNGNRWGGGWYNGGWNWANRPAAWGAAGAAFGWLASSATEPISYENPYYTPSETVVDNYLDYSQPITVPVQTEVQVPVEVPVETPVELPVAAPVETPVETPVVEQSAAPPTPTPTRTVSDTPPPTNEDAQPAATVDPKEQEASRWFETARTAFKKGDYAAAQTDIEKALREIPGDASLHEFRALTLFAQKKYRDAAAVIYAVLAVGPGWGWDTIKNLYPDTQTYTSQLRALEDYQRINASSTEASFLLAYHYLALGEMTSATKQLANVVKLNPKDQLSAQLLKVVKDQVQPDDRPKAEP